MCCGYQRKERCSWLRNAPTVRVASANAQTGVRRVVTQQAIHDFGRSLHQVRHSVRRDIEAGGCEETLLFSL